MPAHFTYDRYRQTRRILGMLLVACPLLVLLLAALQWFLARDTSSLKEGEIFLRSRPTGAAVSTLTVDLRGTREAPLGHTPGPIHLGRHELPTTVTLKLAYFEPLQVRLEPDNLDVVHRLRPLYGPLSHLYYGVRDYPLACVAFFLALLPFPVWLKSRTLAHEWARDCKLFEEGKKVEGVPIGDYRLVRQVGRGGMASVYEARRVGDPDGESLAIKLISQRIAADPESQGRFAREINICRGLSHRNATFIYDWGLWEGRYYLVMELLEGESLSQRLRRSKPTLQETLDIAVQVARALLYAHRQGIIHRDLKPSNVMCVGERIKVMDFGIALRADLERLTDAGDVLGTPGFMAPEQIMGDELNWRADLYPLGVMLYEMLADHPPFEGETVMQLIQNHLKEPPPTLPETVPGALRTLVERLLSKEPELRASRQEQVLEELEALKTELAGET